MERYLKRACPLADGADPEAEVRIERRGGQPLLERAASCRSATVLSHAETPLGDDEAAHERHADQQLLLLNCATDPA